MMRREIRYKTDTNKLNWRQKQISAILKYTKQN